MAYIIMAYVVVTTQAGEARALAKAAASTYKVLGKAQKANQKAALLRAKVKVDAGRAERMVRAVYLNRRAISNAGL